MSFLKKLVSLFTGSARSSRRTLPIYVLSHRCNEPISSDIDLLNSLSHADDADAVYYTRKVLQGSGANRCFTSVEVEIWFDGNRDLLRHEVHGGRWLTEEEYAAELTRFNAPPEEDEEGGETVDAADKSETDSESTRKD